MRGDGRKAKNPKRTLLRLLGYLKQYTVTLTIVAACIFVTAFAQTKSATALGTLVDDFILPMVASGSTDFDPVFRFLLH
jgi:ATP-binding cassette subfamily B protein